MLYFGIDYHKEKNFVCVQTPRGKIISEFESKSTPEGMDFIIEQFKDEKIKVMGETSTYSINLHNYLISRGIDSILVDPSNIELITKSDKKTDRHDAKFLATFLRLMDKGEISLSISYIVVGDQRELRDLCRRREWLASEKGKAVQSMKAHMRIHNQKLENDYDDFSTTKGQLMLRKNFSQDFDLMSSLDDYCYYSNKSDELDRYFNNEKFDTESVRLLMSIPGVGKLTAIELMSMIVDIDRFHSADKMRGYFGMGLRVKDSGERMKHGHITKKGDAMMRSILGRILNCFLIADTDNNVIRYYRSHKDSKGVKWTRTACMNLILNIIFAVLKRKTPYRDF